MDKDKPLPDTIEIQGRTFYYDAEMCVYRKTAPDAPDHWDSYGWLYVMLALCAFVYVYAL
jgi:hypothetical protein